jgi:hypothetical protein
MRADEVLKEYLLLPRVCVRRSMMMKMGSMMMRRRRMGRRRGRSGFLVGE